jgi:hypothetical protein
VSACGRRCIQGEGILSSPEKGWDDNGPEEGKGMAKSIILYNLRRDVSDEDYGKWCQQYKGPFFVSLDACKSFTLTKVIGGVKGNGAEGLPPAPAQSPFKYVGVVDVTAFDEWQRDTESKAFREGFFPQWFSKWVADFYILIATEVFEAGKA